MFGGHYRLAALLFVLALLLVSCKADVLVGERRFDASAARDAEIDLEADVEADLDGAPDADVDEP